MAGGIHESGESVASGLLDFCRQHAIARLGHAGAIAEGPPMPDRRKSFIAWYLRFRLIRAGGGGRPIGDKIV